MARLAGKVAIVTGAARGIGQAIAQEFANEGAKVVLGDVLDDQLRITAEAIQKTQRSASVASIHLDVRVAVHWQATIELAVRTFGGLDILVNNAGILVDSDIVNCSEEDWDRVVDTNLKGPFLGIKYAVPEMRKRGGGSIVNIASIGGLVTTYGWAAYHSSKGGVRLLSKQAATAYGPDNIRSNAICPGTVMTEMVARLPPKTRDSAALGTALRRYGKVEEVAKAAVFLASDDAAFITGVDLPVDGGLTAMRPVTQSSD